MLWILVGFSAAQVPKQIPNFLILMSKPHIEKMQKYQKKPNFVIFLHIISHYNTFHVIVKFAISEKRCQTGAKLFAKYQN